MTRQPDTIRTGRRVAALEDRLRTARADRDAAIRDRYREAECGHRTITLTQIAEEVGLTRQAVYNVLEAAGMYVKRVDRAS